VYHRLLIASLVVREAVRVLLERLADTGDVTVAEDSEASGEEATFDPVSLSTYCSVRKRTSAWAAVNLTVDKRSPPYEDL
jgi:hypothetical protein